MKKQIFSLFAATAVMMSLAACTEETTTTTDNKDTVAVVTPEVPAAENGVMVGGAMMVPSKNIVENASASADHTTLVDAVKAAGLVETLSGPGPFTVFAPTNAAFDAVGKDKIADLMKPENKEKLAKILTYHVVPMKAMSTDLKDGQMIKTVEGGELKVTMKDGKVMINDATVTTADAVSSNGVTYVIDKVMMPK